MSDEPRLRVEPGELRRAADAWRIQWRIANEGTGPLRIVSSWLPHGRFRGEERAHDAAVAPGASVTLELDAKGEGRAGEVVENAFLILRVEQDNARWRVLARITVRFDETRAPRPAVEVVTSLPAGFSGLEEGDR